VLVGLVVGLLKGDPVSSYCWCWKTDQILLLKGDDGQVGGKDVLHDENNRSDLIAEEHRFKRNLLLMIMSREAPGGLEPKGTEGGRAVRPKNGKPEELE
jgi:hypothetical protein